MSEGASAAASPVAGPSRDILDGSKRLTTATSSSSNRKGRVSRGKGHTSYDQADIKVAAHGAGRTVKGSSRSSLAPASRPPRPADPVPCPQCRTSSAWFLCQKCVLSKVEKHRINMARLTAARDSTRKMSEALLGPDPTGTEKQVDDEDSANIPDPFGPPSVLPRNPHPIASHRGRVISSRWSRLTAEINDRGTDQRALDDEVVALRRRVKDKRAELHRRRANLTIARHMLSSEADSTQPGGYRRALEVDIQQLRRKVQTLHEELGKTRRLRQQHLLGFYYVSPPASGITPLLPRSREHYTSGVSEGPGSSPTLASFEWTILPFGTSLALPLPSASEIRRFARIDVNTAATLTCQLLQAMAVICGVALPFSMTIDENGRWSFTADELWAMAGTSAATAKLHIGQSAYAAISGSANPVPSAISSASRGIEASMMSLGASTLSTLESFVTLPGRRNKAWGRASALQALESNQSKEVTGNADSLSATGAGTSSKKTESAVSSARDFCRALTMLAYNAAYLAWSQGVQIDLVKAGGSTLKLLYEAAHAVGTKRSHLATPPSINALQDFTFPALDFSKLLQLHELHYGASSPQGNTPTKASRWPPTTEMEESYVDAGQAAASIVNIQAKAREESPIVNPQRQTKQSSTAAPSRSSFSAGNRSSAVPLDRRTVSTTHRQMGDTPMKSASGLGHPAAAVNKQGPPRHLNLDFLRQRGEKALRDGELLARGSGDPGRDKAGTPTSTGVSLQAVNAGSKSRGGNPTEGKARDSRLTSGAAEAREMKGVGSKSSPSSSSAKPANATTSASAGAVIFNGKEVGVGSGSRHSGRRKAHKDQRGGGTEGTGLIGILEAERGAHRPVAPALSLGGTPHSSAAGSISESSKGKGRATPLPTDDETDEWDVL